MTLSCTRSLLIDPGPPPRRPIAQQQQQGSTRPSCASSTAAGCCSRCCCSPCGLAPRRTLFYRAFGFLLTRKLVVDTGYDASIRPEESAMYVDKSILNLDIRVFIETRYSYLVRYCSSAPMWARGR